MVVKQTKPTTFGIADTATDIQLQNERNRKQNKKQNEKEKEMEHM